MAKGPVEQPAADLSREVQQPSSPVAADADTRPLDSSPSTPDALTLFRRGKSAIDLLEAIRVTDPDRLADLAKTLPDATAEDLPQSIGRFRILRELGRGGYGVVLLAHDPHLNRRVALKVPRPEALVTAELRRRFLREAEAAAALNHPNIVPIFEQGMVGPICYVASAYCEGPSMAEWLAGQQEPVPPRQAADIVLALADAVQHAHSRGVLHRDLKPANVLMVRQENSPKAKSSALTPLIIDFGLARMEGLTGQTTSTAIVGTPAYMAPEQAAGRNDAVTAAVDIHGLGVILYQLLTLNLPYRGGSNLELLQAIQSQEPIAPRRVQGGIPRDLEAICLKCLEKQPDRRYASAAHLYADLGRFLAGRTVAARPIGPLARMRRWGRRNPALAATSTLAVILFVTGSATVFWQWRRAERNLIQARQQQQRATRHLRAAQDAVDELLSGIAAEMHDLPQTEAIRKRLLSRAAAINQRFLTDESVDFTSAGIDSIKAWHRAAEIAWQMGDLPMVESALQKLIALCESIPPSDRSTEVVAEHVIALCRLSGVAAERSDSSTAAQFLHQGLTMLDRVSAEPSTRLNAYRAELLRCLGMDAATAGNVEKAGEFFGQAVKLVEQTAATDDENTDELLLRAKAHNSYAIHCKQTAQWDEAVRHFGRTHDILTRLRQQSPESAEYQCMMAQNQYNLANLDMVAGRLDQARSRYLQAKNEFKQLAAKFPQVVQYRDLWCHSLQAAALASKGTERRKSRIVMLKKAAFLREEILREYPDLVDNLVALAKTYRNLGKDQMLAQEYAAARSSFRRAIECGPTPGSSDAVKTQDQEDDAWACSLLAQLEMQCQDWKQARHWYEQALALGQPVARSPMDQLRDQAGLGLAIARSGDVEEGLRLIRQLPPSNPELPDADLIAAKVLIDVAELFEGDRQQELQVEAVRRLRSAWQQGQPDVKEYALTTLGNKLGQLPEYRELAEEIRKGAGL